MWKMHQQLYMGKRQVYHATFILHPVHIKEDLGPGPKLYYPSDIITTENLKIVLGQKWPKHMECW